MRIHPILQISLILFIFFLSCEKESSSLVISDSNDLVKLEIKYLDGEGYSNLMPPNPHDPVGISFRLEFRNRSISDSINELHFENCYVFLTTDSLLGEVEIIPWYDINFAPSSVDTVTLGKRREDTRVFDPPCRKSIYLTFDIKDKYDNLLNFQTDSIFYECDY